MAKLASFLLISLVSMAFAIPLFLSSVEASDQWMQAQATAFGDSAGTINGGACGYGGYNSGYGTNTVAISTALLGGGAGCGTCFEIRCDESGSKACASGGPTSVLVTVTNFCPQGGNGWCNPPHKHFSISETAFNQIATSTGAPVPVLYRRASCQREGGIQFTINGGSNYNVILITNVGGNGQVKAVSIKGSKQPSTWVPLTHLWGSNWKTPHDMHGQSLSFQVVLTDGTTVTSNNVTNSSWQLGQTFLGNQVP